MATRTTDLRRAVALSTLSIAWSGVAGSVAIYAAVASGSLSLLGFGADAVIDAVASAALIWRFAAESRQPERAHRFERTAERVVGSALIALALYLAAGSLRSLAAQAHPETSSASVALLLASAVALPPLAVAKYRIAARLGSGALRADSFLTGAAVLLAVISLVSVAATDAFGFWWADAVAALIVGAIVLREGWSSLALST
ncbi:MAG: cation transporter [Chloroflexota bacterium]|nr:cation transporter [Chloroflexota bacterium]